jgi:UDP-N-acetylmuramoyl-tripeptide--D-alanyl-D-alanine ligase
VTSIGTAHIGYFGSLNAIAEEKETLVRALAAHGCAVLNADDPRVISMRAVIKAKIITFGFSATADVRATSVEFLRDPMTLAVQGLRVMAVSGPHQISFDLLGVLGKGHVRAALSALAVARALGLPLAVAAAALATYAPPPSRLRLIPGIKNTVLIDDSYNASPAAMFDALEVLKEYPVPTGRKRIALLGDMRELGDFTDKAHEEVGERVAKDNVDLFVAVGEAMHGALEAAKRAGMSEDHCFHLTDAVSAGRFLQERIRPGDVILIKGSQNTIRLERAVKELMAEPERAAELICRQGKEWV